MTHSYVATSTAVRLRCGSVRRKCGSVRRKCGSVRAATAAAAAAACIWRLFRLRSTWSKALWRSRRTRGNGLRACRLRHAAAYDACCLRASGGSGSVRAASGSGRLRKLSRYRCAKLWIRQSRRWPMREIEIVQIETRFVNFLFSVFCFCLILFCLN
jgi:hypothetical protein